MTTKYLVFGNGLLGSSFSHVPNTAILPKSVCDITDKDSIVSAIRYYKPEVVINTAGIVPKNKVPIDYIFKVNSFAPHYIADACSGKCKFIHISTNCVFDGERAASSEQDKPSATDTYGMSKLFGEPTNALVIRTSFIGLPDPNGRGLLAWLASQDQITGYDRVLWNGITTLELVNKLLYYSDYYTTGIRHVYSYTESKYYLLQLANEVFFNGSKKVDKESELTDTPHMESKTLHSLYPTGFITKPIEQQMKELAHAIKR